MADETEQRSGDLESLPRRRVTVLFTDLSDSTSLAASIEAEICAEMIDDVRQVFEAAVAARKGTINQLQGDGFQALFGNPQATEEDGQRATEVALEVHERVRALRAKYAVHGAPDLSVHSGIHAGLVLAHPGDSIAGRYKLYGPTPGIAKHLSDIAEADEILVSEETLGPGSYLFHTSERRLVTVKGRESAFAVHRILARTSLRTRFEAHTQRGLVPFIGRQAELRWLARVLDSARQGQPRFVAISATAGVGKTRLAEEFLGRAAASGCAISRGYCESELNAEPLQPFLQMLRTQLGLTPGTPPASAAQAVEQALAEIQPALLAHRPALLQALSVPMPSTEGSAPRRAAPDQTIAAVRDLFAALAQAGPRIVFLDDWQWADQATRQVVFAICALRDLPILVLAATRPLELGDAQLTAADVLELNVFSDDEADSTINQLLPAANPFVTRAIRQHAGGNALFIEELCHSAGSTAEGQASLGAAPAGSVWLDTLIESRVTRLPLGQCDVLRAAAVIGNVVPTWQLESLTGCGEDHPTVHALAAQDFIFPGDRSGTLRFKHGITRDVVYAAIGLHRRRAMHQRIAALIRERSGQAEAEAVEALAYHHAGAADFAQAARYAEMAGDKAMAASSIDRAKTQYRAALAMLDRLPDTPERYQAWRSIVRRLGMASVFDPTRGELAILQRAINVARQHNDDAGSAYAQYWLAYVNYALGESRAAVAQCGLALAAATALGDARLTEQVHITLGQALGAASDYPRGLELLEAATLPQATRRDSGRPGASIAFSLACKASILGDLGRFDDAQACCEEAMRAAPWPGHEVQGSVLCWRSGVAVWQGDWPAAREAALQAQQIAERVKSLYLFGMSRALGAYADWKLEHTPGSLRTLAEAVSWLESHDKSLFISLAHGWLTEATAEAGLFDDMRRHAARALRRARKRDWLGAAMTFRTLASVAATEGDWPRAERHLQRAVRVARLRASPHEAACNELCRARMALQRVDRPLAIDCINRAADAFSTMRMAWHLAQAQQLRDSLR